MLPTQAFSALTTRARPENKALKSWPFPTRELGAMLNGNISVSAGFGEANAGVSGVKAASAC